MLLLDYGRTVSIDRLVDAVWTDSAPPATARQQIQNCTAAVRRELQAARCEGHRPADCKVRIVVCPGGYRLEASPWTVDAVRFGDVVRECVSAGDERDDEAAATALREALELWTGAAYGGIPALELQAEAARLEELKLVAVEELACRELQLGRSPELHAAELSAQTRRYPHRERLWLLQMDALHRSGRTSEALERFREYRSMLVAAHGVEPGPEIRAKEREILQRSG